MNDSNRVFLPALFAVGGGLAALPATALELGDVTVQSTLGQPLRASIAYALGPNEQLHDFCVSLRPALANRGLPEITQAQVSVAGGIISLTGRAPVREPLMAVRVNLACPYTPHLSREYMLFIDPAQPAAETVTHTAPVAAAEPQAVAQPAPRTATRPTARRMATPPAPSTPIERATRYRVQPGDTLSTIAARIENRPVGLWAAVDGIFAANPHAFIDDDPNKLMAGSWLAIPDFGSGVAPRVSQADRAVVPVAAPTPVAEPAPVVEPLAELLPVVEPAPAATQRDAAVSSLADSIARDAAIDDTTVLEPVSPALPDDIRPGDVVEAGDNGYVIADTALEPPATAASPNSTTARIASPDRPQPARSNWLLWLMGGGIALLGGLLVFGRRSRERGEPEPVAPVAPHPMRRASDSITVEVLAEPEYDIDDDSPTAENLALDADLVMGTGLSEGTDIDVHQDFSFAATSELDMEFSDADIAEAAEEPETDIIAPPAIEESSILEKEVLPSDDDYDMSVIVDATKMPQPEDATRRDLKAIPVTKGDDTLITDNYTLSQDVDYQILEQDYEDELTATQALNKEIERAAAQLAERLEDRDEDSPAAAAKLATVTELDPTARMRDSEHAADAGDTDATEEITQEMLSEESTVEMPAGDEDTVEMTVETGKVDTKAG